MRKFDSYVQELKYKVLREVARHTWMGNESFAVFDDIANQVVRKDEIPRRCCIYKDRAIVAERIKIALGGDKENPNVIEVIDIACDECPEAGHVVTDMCRGCIAHKCEDACKLGAISFDEELVAHIDKKKCVECGKCAKVCPYSAIMNFTRPCENACKAGAIHMAEEGEAEIDNEKCTSCGACVFTCPFGATVDKSYITDIIHLIKDSDNNKKYKVHAVVAPAIASQFEYATLGQMVAAIKKLGFCDVTEVALGADMVAYGEAEELAEKGFLTTSCCPAFVSYIKANFPDMEQHISHNLSPMATLAKHMKEKDPDGKIVFIGPCTAKKAEVNLDSVKDYVDYAMTFEELQAMIDSRDIEAEKLEEESFEDASYYGRIFARTGGVAEAVTEALKEQGSDFEIKAGTCAGLDKCKTALMRASKGASPYNLIEGMACEGGCVGGAGCLTHSEANRKAIDKYGKDAGDKTIEDAIKE
ncbi:MAG: 4Fe-4S dicluster domain-containing protein [Eubacteriaceae bacterium]|nr:4Fe-4S dicluster domain-containing protein [Eubacteriaceae bacterium]